MKTLLDRALTEPIRCDDPEGVVDGWWTGLQIEAETARMVADGNGWLFPRRANLIHEIAERGVLSQPECWEPDCFFNLPSYNDDRGSWFEWGDAACWLCFAPGWSGERIVQFQPVHKMSDGGCFLHPLSLAPVKSDGGRSWVTIRTNMADGATNGKVIGGAELADDVAVAAAWYAIAAISLMAAEGITIAERQSQPDRWMRRYEKRHGEPPVDRIGIRLTQPTMSPSDHDVCFHYTRSHTKFFSGEPGHRFFGSTEPRTVSTPSFWSGNINKGITIDRLDHS